MGTLTELRSAVAVAEVGSFTGAAERLGVRTQRVSRHVQALEAQLGVRLFDRTTRRVHITEAGAALLARARRLLDDYGALVAEAQDAQQVVRGRVRIAAPVTFGEARVVPVIAALGACHPELEVELVLADRYVDLVGEGVALAVRVGELRDASWLARRVGHTALVCVASPAYIARAGQPDAPDALNAHRVIHDANLRGGPRWPLGNGDGVWVRPWVTVNSARAACTLALTGAGIALVPRFVASDALASGRLIALLAPHMPPPRPVHLLRPPGGSPTARVRVVMDALAEALGDSAS